MAIKAREQAETAETTKRSHTLLESRLAHLQGENDEVKRVLASVEIELNACQNHVTSLQKDVSSGNKQVAEAIEARSVLEEALGRVRADLKKQSSEYKALEGSHGDLQRKIDQAWKDIMTLSRSYISTLRHWQTGVDNLLLETRSGFGGFADQHLDGIVLQLKAAENVRPTPPSCSFLQEVHGAWRKRKRAALEGRRDHDTVPQEPDWPGTALGPDVVQPFIEQLTAAAMDISGRLDSLEGKIHELFDLSGKSMGIVLEAAVDAQRRTKETMKKCLIKASMHSVTAFKPEEALSLMDMDSRQDREIQSFLSDIAAAVQGTMELLKDKQHKTETDLLCAEGKIEALVSIRDQQELQIHDLNKALGEVRAHYHDAQEGLAMLEGDRQDAVKKMEEAAMKLRIETRESDNLREDVKAGLKRIGELEAEVERLERLEAAACQAQKRAMEMGAEKFFKHRQGWRQIIETVGRIKEGVSILKGETTGSLDCLREVCEGFFKRCELRMVELARQKHDADLALEQITSKRQQRSNDTSKRAGPGPTNLMSEVLGNDRADTVSPGMDDASSHVQQEGAPIAD
ncbi:unnamed protein product [Ostreobium quekettii]|uniref:Uncharacterized protein n=1 Tax=Ostreobium quekettii TaxID=121088 RepID=A0A8S1ISM1_9CHLO|nr:unnamed protein product [Ostreobium quekettii]